ncbi:ParB/RepB/Spo0J family partition protein [Microbacterium sp. M4A5_1d]
MTTEQIDHVATVDVVIDTNVRRTVDVDKSFVSSIRNHGILQPPVGWRDDAGKVHITMGQRRTLAAKEIGLDTIPVIIRTQTEAEQARIVAQLAENEQRQSLTPADTAAAYAQLQFEFGVTTEQIARKTNSPKAKVQTALAVAESAAAKAALAASKISLEQAAVFTEFESDESALEQLSEIVKERPEQLEHAAERIRRDREQKRRVDELALQLERDGWEVIRSEYQYGYTRPANATSLRDLHRADDATKTPLKADDVAGIDGRVAVVYPQHGSEAGASCFLRHPDKHGFVSHAYASGGGGKGPLTDEEKAARRKKREDRADMLAATTVRRAWLKDTFLPRKHTFETVGAWIVRAMLKHPDALRYEQARGEDAKVLTWELLGLKVEGHPDFYSNDGLGTLEKVLQKASTADELRLLVAFAIARVEHPAGNPKYGRFGQHTALGPYLTQLAAWGYPLADIEQRLIDEHTAELEDREKRRAAREARQAVEAASE